MADEAAARREVEARAEALGAKIEAKVEERAGIKILDQEFLLATIIKHWAHDDIRKLVGALQAFLDAPAENPAPAFSKSLTGLRKVMSPELLAQIRADHAEGMSVDKIALKHELNSKYGLYLTDIEKLVSSEIQEPVS